MRSLVKVFINRLKMRLENDDSFLDDCLGFLGFIFVVFGIFSLAALTSLFS